MFDVHAFLAKLVELLRHQELWVPLAIVLPMTAWAGFKAGCYFPYFNARVRELETKLKESLERVAESETKLKEALEREAESETKLEEALEREAKCDKIHKAVLNDE